MTIDKALTMIDEYLLADCVDEEWQKCLRYVKWLIVHYSDLVDKLVITNEHMRNNFTDTHHNETEQAYKNGYEAGVTEFVDRFIEEYSLRIGEDEEVDEIIDNLIEELTEGCENE